MRSTEDAPSGGWGREAGKRQGQGPLYEQSILEAEGLGRP